MSDYIPPPIACSDDPLTPGAATLLAAFSAMNDRSRLDTIAVALAFAEHSPRLRSRPQPALRLIHGGAVDLTG